MATVDTNLDSAIFTGNSQFVFSGSNLYVVGNTTTTGSLDVFLSTDYGYTFTNVGSVTVAGDTTKGFDPAVCLDSGGILRIVGTIYGSGGSTSLGIYFFNISTHTFASNSPFIIVAGSQIGRDYDVAMLPDLTVMVVSSLLNQGGFYGETVMAYFLSASTSSPAVLSSHELTSSPFRSGNTFGTVSTLANATGVEVYLGSHNKVFTFTPFPASITLYKYTQSTTTWATSTLTTIMCQYIDDRMTIIGDGTKRYLSQCFFTQTRYSLVGNALLGYSADSGATWSWESYLGTGLQSITDPVISVAPEGLRFSYVEKNFTSTNTGNVMNGTLRVKLLGVAPWSITIDPTFYNVITTSRLRGTKDKLLAGMLYALMGETTSGDGQFYTGYSVPPVAAIATSTISLPRGSTLVLDASASYDLNGSPLRFTWSTDNAVVHVTPIPDITGAANTAAIFTPTNTAAPLQTAHVSVVVEDLDLNGNPIHPWDPVHHTPASELATCTVTIPLLLAPVIGYLSPFNVSRGTIVRIAPTITDDAVGVTLSYAWTQVSGTTIALSDTDFPFLNVLTQAALLTGESLVFSLSVSDGINLPVFRNFTINVAAHAFAEPDTFISRGVWSGNIAQRNTAGSYLSDESCLASSLNNYKKYTMIDGTERTLVVTPTDIMVFNYSGATDTTPQQVILRRFFPPGFLTVVDGVQTEDDYTIMLASDGNLYKYTTAPAINTDNYDSIIYLPSLTSMTFNKLLCTYNFNNTRVLALSGPQGCYLLQIDNAYFTTTIGMAISPSSKLLFGGSNVVWIRTNNVESTIQGKVLLGTVQNGNTYETLIDLSKRIILGTWESANLSNAIVDSGEILFNAESSYMGFPSPPVLVSALVGTISHFIAPVWITWTQNRPDLISLYNLFTSNDGGTSWSEALTVTNGNQLSAILPMTQGYTYQLRMRAINTDGVSGWSNVLSVSI
jgi:hypothetical protein